MKIAKLILSLSLCLMAAPVLAQESNAPGRVNGMSDQDYQIQRQKLLARMKAASPQHGSAQEERAKAEPVHGTTYGQGYGSRKDGGPSKPSIETSRPERPERPERPHFERPGR